MTQYEYSIIFGHQPNGGHVVPFSQSHCLLQQACLLQEAPSNRLPYLFLQL